MESDPFAIADDAAVSIDLGDPGPMLARISDAALSGLAAAIAAEQQQRAITAGDHDALIELGFAEGFRSDGLPVDPWIVGGLIVCPGGRVDRSATSHDCAFVSINDEWVWESPETILDVVRHVPGRRPQMRSVSLVAGYDGLALDLVASRMKTGVHEMRSVRSFVVRDGQLELVQARARRVDHNR